MTKLAYGVDFGTTNSAIGVCSLEGAPLVIPVEGSGRRMMPSTIYFPNHEAVIYTGTKAMSEYAEWRDGRFIQSIKTILPSRQFTGTTIRGTLYEATDLVAVILERLKQAGDRYTGQDIRRAVFGRPVEFSEDRSADKLAEERLREAAELAGFEEVHFQLEPVAAALSYELTLRENRLTLIADLGGGSSDFTLVELGPGRIARSGKAIEVIASRGLMIAGDTFDTKLMATKIKSFFGEGSTYDGFLSGTRLSLPNSILADLCSKGRIIYLYTEGLKRQLEDILRTTDDPKGIMRLIKLINHNLGFSIFSVVERSKKELTSAEQTRLSFDKEGIQIDAVVTRKEFEAMIEEDIERIAYCVDELLRESQIIPSQIESVYLTGGSSLVPAVRRMLTDKFGMEKLVSSPDPSFGVITGLTLSTKFVT